MSTPHDDSGSSLPPYQANLSGPGAGGIRPAPPTQVTTAFWLYIAAAALSIVSLIISLATIGTSREAVQRQLEASGQPISGSALDAIIAGTVIISVVFAIIWVGVYVLFAFFMKRGANWARIVLTILAALSLLNILSGYGVGALQALAAIIATVLIWLRPASEYFQAVKESRQVGYRHP